ncbi:MAG: hypothetical protein GXP26_14595 [Planctomycetes bacterium]|nr:hypothetical protein [Planctomycetota bacterium]
MDTSRVDRICRFELLEPRQLLAANPLPGLFLGGISEPAVGDQTAAPVAHNSEPGLIRGGVRLSTLATCQIVNADPGLAGVSIRLLNETGNLVNETVTGSDGTYEFVGLAPGIYAVQEIQPDGYAVGRAFVGSGGGIAFDSNLIGEIVVSGASQLVDYDFCDYPIGDTDPQGGGDKLIDPHSIDGGDNRQQEDRLTLSNGIVQMQNAMNVTTRSSDLLVQQTPIAAAFNSTTTVFAPVVQFASASIFGGSSQGVGYAWHLSIVDGGGPLTSLEPSSRIQLASTQFDVSLWQTPPLDQGSWTTRDDREPVFFGHPDAKPVVGDWDGDGRDEFGIFLDGDWYLDLNGNGRWDEADLWAHLGFPGDLPVTGDWDADGKTDIGVYGPIHSESSKEQSSDAETSDAPQARTSSLPVRAERTMRRTAQGHICADAVDHVFHYGAPGDYPVTGDWNGDGRETIAVFRDGTWYLDIDGDGRFTSDDVTAHFGKSGDLPVVGDWTGTGIDHLGIYRAGTWILDQDGNQRLDQAEVDLAFELGNPGDQPVVGDWDGDGTDDPAVYSPDSALPRVANRRAS